MVSVKRVTKKERLVEKCKTLALRDWSEGGIASFNEYNQFLCDYIEEIIERLDTKGLEWLKEEMERVHENMPKQDRY